MAPEPPPVVNVANSALIVGQPVPVPITLEGPQVQRDRGDTVRVEVSVIGGVGQIGAQSGATITLEGTVGEIIAQLATLMVTAEQPGEVIVKFRGYPVARPEEVLTGTGSLSAADASPTPTVTPTLTTTTPTAEPSPQPEVVSAPETNLRSFDPKQDPAFVITSAVTAAAVLGVVGAGALAPGFGGPGSGGSGSGGSGSGGSGSGGSAPAGGRRPDAAGTESWLADIADTSLTAGAVTAGSATTLGWGDRRRTWRAPLSSGIDQGIARGARRLAQASPLVLRLIDDGTYLRAMLGSLAGLLPLLGLLLGTMAVVDVQGQAVTPALWLVGAIVVIGCLNALAGAAAVLAFVVGLAVSGGLVPGAAQVGLASAGGVRLIMGLCLIAFGPALVASGTRPLRRSADDPSGLWERLADFVVIPLVAGFLVQGTVRALPGLVGLELPIAADANALAILAVAAMVARVGLEEVVARGYPNRLNQIELPDLPQPGVAQRIIAIVLRTVAFAFVSEAFIGMVWQLWVGVGLFLLTQALFLMAPRMPNSPTVFHLVPVGVPRFLLVLLASLGLATAATLLVGDGPEASRWAFVFLLLPGLLLAGIGMFGRSPAPGDTRWYLRPGMRLWYRVGGVVLVALSVWASQLA